MKICLSGATGHVGQELAKAILAASDLRLVSAVGRRAAGQRLGDVVIDATLPAALRRDQADVVIDYTHPDAVKGHVRDAVAAGCSVVVGTSGLTDADYAEIDGWARAKQVGVFAAGNFSVTAALLQHFAMLAAKQMPHWEILDYAGDAKPDAPSGTARELAYQLAQVASPRWQVPVADTKGMREARGATLNASQLHSVRVPGYYSAVQAVFGDAGERIELRHESTSYAPYVTGTLLAARQVQGFTGLRRGMSQLLGL
ncbi:MAG TPA: 4-hydroxy-tetrahydrodipicolinate reductase [Gammaproteobacteria bacterium]|jgi:4-hydroxy-tetrahydrodipicolinate reductase